MTFGASQTAVGLKEDLTRGVVDRFRSMPMARSAVLAGRTVADLVRNILIIGLMIAVGYLVGFRFHGGAAGAAGCTADAARRSPCLAPRHRWEQQRHGSAACWPYSSPCPYRATGRSASVVAGQPVGVTWAATIFPPRTVSVPV